jgi:HSP20 family protein
MRALMPWRREAPLSTLHKEIDELFDRFFGEDERWWARPLEALTVPAVESFLKNGEVVVRADLPGIDPKDVELSVDGERLTIKGERKVEREEKGEHLYHEVSYGRFERVLALPPGVDPDTVKATYKNGVLEITMKAPKGLESKKVPITVH